MASHASSALLDLGPTKKSAGSLMSQMILQQLLEMALTLATTQIVAWFNSPSSADLSGDMDMEDFGKPRGGVKGEFLYLRKPFTGAHRLSARIKRELAGELAMDMAALLSRSQSVLERNGTQKEANIALILRGFLEERVMSR